MHFVIRDESADRLSVRSADSIGTVAFDLDLETLDLLMVTLQMARRELVTGGHSEK